MGKKVYISGGITDVPQAEERFLAAEKMLVHLGCRTVNPMSLPHDHDKTWQNYMKEDLSALLYCDAVYMLDGWKDSKGARLEHGVAAELGLEVFYESNFFGAKALAAANGLFN